MKRISRRQTLRICTSSSIVLLSGCQGDFPESRTIDFTDVQVTKKGAKWLVETTVRARDNTGRGFHNVTIVGRSKDDTVVCRKFVGNMSVETGQTEVQITLSCSKFPTSIIPKADESTCEENAYLDKRVYNKEWLC